MEETELEATPMLTWAFMTLLGWLQPVPAEVAHVYDTKYDRYGTK